MSEQKPRRINVAVTEDAIGALERMIEREGVTLTEAVRRLLGYGDFVYQAIKVDGGELVQHDRNGKMREVVLL